MVNENLADALFYTGVMNDFSDLLTDVKSAATVGGKAKLLLVDHIGECLVQNPELKCYGKF